MSEEVYTVEQFAERLKLHPKTVLKFIREGRVRAVKVGRSYRILRSDMEALAGMYRTAEARRPTRATTIVDIEDLDPTGAERLTSMLTGARMGGDPASEPLNLSVAHDPARRSLKVVITSSPGDAAAMLRMIDVWSER